MKKSLTTAVCIALTVAVASTCWAKRERRNAPKKRDVETLLKEMGEPHFIERMKVSTMCSLSIGETYYHIFTATLKDGTFRIIIYNNVPEYLGYYATQFEPIDYEDDGILLDSGDGELKYKLTIGSKGPPKKVRFGTFPVEFVKNPNLEKKKEEKKDSGDGTLTVPTGEEEAEEIVNSELLDYRDWTLTLEGQEMTVNAKFEKLEGGNIFLKSSKNGEIASVPGSALSAADKDYLRGITGK